MSGFPHPMVRRSDRKPIAEAVGDNCPFNGQNPQPKVEMESNTTSPVTVEMESNTTSPVTVTEFPDTDSSDELTEQVPAASPPPVSGSPGVRMGLSADAVPFPPPVASEVEPEDTTETNINIKHEHDDDGGLKIAT